MWIGTNGNKCVHLGSSHTIDGVYGVGNADQSECALIPLFVRTVMGNGSGTAVLETNALLIYHGLWTGYGELRMYITREQYLYLVW